jgi:hypothetical protein
LFWTKDVLQYCNLIHWQDQWLGSVELDEHVNHWSKQSPVIEFIKDCPALLHQSSVGAWMIALMLIRGM